MIKVDHWVLPVIFVDCDLSCLLCWSGIWILYAEVSYNTAAASASNWWGWGEGFCSNVPASFANTASSLRSLASATSDANNDDQVHGRA